MTSRLPTLCVSCTNFSGEGKCRAFPEGIPEEILVQGADHRTSVPGDNGIVFSPKSDADSQYLLQGWQAFNEAIPIE